MTARAIEMRIKKLSALEEQKKELEKQIEVVKGQIQEEMGEAETLETPAFIIRWTTFITSRFDSKKFKADHEKLFNQYSKETSSRRFSYSAR